MVAPVCSAGVDFYDRGSEGWFWYRDPRLTAPPPPAPPPAPAAPSASITPPSPAAPGPAPLSAAWFRDNLQRYQDAAIDDPTPQNVAVYFALQKVMMDKSSRFADAANRVVSGDPVLDEITRRPTATFGANLMNRAAADGRDAVLGRIAGFAALWFFYRSDCPYCEAQAPLLRLLAEHYGFSVLPIALDGKALPGGAFDAFTPDAGQGARLGVRATPALFLVRPDNGRVSPLAQGLLSLAQLQERIVTAAVREGWISEEEAQGARAVADAGSASPGPLTELPEDPAALLAYLRALADRRGESAP